MICAIVLAAGESRRMGRQKLLLPFNGTTVISSVINTAFKGGVCDITVVLGANGDAIASEIQDLPVRTVRNQKPNGEMFSSIQCGIRALPAEAEVCFVMLGDQPAFHFEIITRLLERYTESKNGIIMPSFRGKKGHPILIDMKYRQEMLKLAEDRTLRDFLALHKEEWDIFETEDPDILFDIDTPDDYSRLLESERWLDHGTGD